VSLQSQSLNEDKIWVDVNLVLVFEKPV
jgi:hypothetical protein